MRARFLLDAGYLRGALSSSLDVPTRQVVLDPVQVLSWGSSLVAAESASLESFRWYDAELPRHDRHRSRDTAVFQEAAELGAVMRLGHMVERSEPMAPLRRALTAVGVDLERFEQRFHFQPTLVQKGVDTRMVLDMVRGASLGEYDLLFLFAGDGDLTPAVEEVQALGAGVVLVYSTSASAASSLVGQADRAVALADEAVADLMRIRPPMQRSS